MKLADGWGCEDVDAMLDRMTPQQFDEWIAYRSIEPDWRERLIYSLRRGLVMLCCSWGAKNPEAIERELMLPAERDQQTQTLSPNQAVQMLGAYVPLRRST